MSSLVLLRSSTTLTLQLQHISPRLLAGASLLYSGVLLKLSKFQKHQISYFAFSYSMMCITVLFVFCHWPNVSLILIYFVCKYTTFFDCSCSGIKILRCCNSFYCLLWSERFAAYRCCVLEQVSPSLREEYGWSCHSHTCYVLYSFTKEFAFLVQGKFMQLLPNKAILSIVFL